MCLSRALLTVKGDKSLEKKRSVEDHTETHGRKKAYGRTPDDIHALPDYSGKGLVLRTGHVVLSCRTKNRLEKDIVTELGTFKSPFVGICD